MTQLTILFLVFLTFGLGVGNKCPSVAVNPKDPALLDDPDVDVARADEISGVVLSRHSTDHPPSSLSSTSNLTVTLLVCLGVILFVIVVLNYVFGYGCDRGV